MRGVIVVVLNAVPLSVSVVMEYSQSLWVRVIGLINPTHIAYSLHSNVTDHRPGPQENVIIIFYYYNIS